MITENYEYNAVLEFDPDQGLYNLFITTINGSIVNKNLFFFFCEKRHAGRLDLVSADIYKTTKWTGTICVINNMFHPHQVRDGDVITYLSETDMENIGDVPESIKQSSGLASSVKSDLINALKKKRPDPSRKKFQDNRGDDILPPTILPDNSPQIVISNSKIQIAPNLFNNPNTVAGEDVTTTDSITTDNILQQNPPNTEDQIERVLVRRYIKKATE